MAEENYPMVKGTIVKLDRSEDRGNLTKQMEEFEKKNKVTHCPKLRKTVSEVIDDNAKKALEAKRKDEERKEKSKGKNNKDYQTQISWGNRK